MIRMALAVLVFVASVSAAGAADDEQAKMRDIMTLMSLTRTDAVVVRSLDQTSTIMADALRKQYHIEDKALLDDIRRIHLEEFDRHKDAFYNAAASLYAKYFTHEDIRQMIAFYETPSGRKIISLMPAITADVMEIAARMQVQVARGAAPRLEALMRDHAAARGNREKPM